ncbi:MaoC family dehydratase N-terminal domain-containing protein (plasmid) [Cupriavidus sp. KK10]|jgi:acyl dehydratase|uniref:MaoC family dehydratase N-terminal domain-containing protein n=1 Tax=Cupriavidus sp. KK10 TaxID=1478019 RepID=UPI001BAA8D6B|nr:MaoC family dehydratase N-terminal domain-containing protein [Cupriavidus sp. KK10]QUN32801.1 MaoC family dehydratase N-terminal domain-containing protein [Cupriavidus sp. KK10]
MLDKNLIGHSFGKRSINVEEWAVRWYANAIGETDPVYSDVAAAHAAGHRSLRVPPTFLSCMEGWLFKTFDLLALARIEPSRVLHAEQQYDYHVPVHVGDTLTYEPRIVDIYDKKGGALEFLVKESRITNQDGVHVADARSVLVQRQI